MSFFGLATTNDLDRLSANLQSMMHVHQDPTQPPVTPQPAPQPVPPVSPVPQPSPKPAPIPTKMFGVNMAGGDFGTIDIYGASLPGIMNTSYIYPTNPTTFKYFYDKGLKIFRIPFRWERIQHTDGSYSAPDVYSLLGVLDTVQQVGGLAFLDMHNYGRYDGTPITSANRQAFADIWKYIAQHVGKHSALFGYELMNEPTGDLPEGADGWNKSVQAAIDAIRSTGDTNTIFVPGFDWQSAERWANSNPNIQTITDPANKLVFSAHEYFDPDASGKYSSLTPPSDVNIGATRVQPFINWCKQHNVRGFISEYGAPAGWETILENFLAPIDAEPLMLGATAWENNPWWLTDPNWIGKRADGSDAPQMAALTKYPTK